jgi:hypothetical protein
MTRRFVYRFRFLMFLWLARRWPRNPFLFFLDVATLLFDAVLLVFLPYTARLHVMSAYAVRIDLARMQGALPEMPSWAAHALRRALGQEP